MEAIETEAIQIENTVRIAPGWTDTAGRLRTWLLISPDGETLAEVTRKRQAERLQGLLQTAFTR